ncbi:MAG: co-chaperone GroES [Bacteroidetes bacterium]|nr:MAG: co-chaperone GroES [Bacteroidota bacterium]RLD71661.1 MAG: co-chaperone GroES [Bacteroidota bacterium]RLD98213.1 MAG: co-chaperone GroES [Bacteroidota bacterium]
MKELQPINQHVLLEMEAKEEKTASGIIIPDTVQEKSQFAKVMSISGIEDPEISIGDMVFYKNFSGIELEFDGKEYLMMPYADILGRIVETDKI